MKLLGLIFALFLLIYLISLATHNMEANHCSWQPFGFYTKGSYLVCE